MLNELIEKLSSNLTEEDNLNGSTIISDMLEVKDFYSVLCKRNIVQKLIDFAFPNELST